MHSSLVFENDTLHVRSVLWIAGRNGVLKFLNDNAGAIQAVAAILYVIATIVLVGITARYVSLTRGLLQIQQATGRERASELKNVTLTIRSHLLRYPIRPDTAAGKMKEALPVEEGDLSRFQTLASQFSVDIGEHAAKMAAAVRWLSARVREVQQTDPKLGYDWSRFPWPQWNEEMARANEHVSEVWRAVTTD